MLDTVFVNVMKWWYFCPSFRFKNISQKFPINFRTFKTRVSKISFYIAVILRYGNFLPIVHFVAQFLYKLKCKILLVLYASSLIQLRRRIVFRSAESNQGLSFDLNIVNVCSGMHCFTWFRKVVEKFLSAWYISLASLINEFQSVACLRFFNLTKSV